MKIFSSILFLSFSSATIIAQVDTSSFRQNLDNILEDITNEKDDSQLYDQIEYLEENPINLNTATTDDLMQIPFLDHEDALAIIKERTALGKFNSVDQLYKIPSISPEVINQILPFISLKEESNASPFEYLAKSFRMMEFNYRSRIIRDLQQDYAYQNGKYYGSDLKFYNRLILNNRKNIHAALVTEKDPGEKSITDYTSFHLMLKDMGIVQNLLIGDYNFEFGQGLALWSRASINKGTETVGITLRDSKGIKPYQSSDENMFFRGAAAKFSFGDFNLYSFFSNKYLDGTIDPNSNQIKSIITAGYHRDSSEVAKKHVINEKIFGASIDYNFNNLLNVGFLYYRSAFVNNFCNHSVLDPSNNKFDYFSANYNFIYDKLMLCGEATSNSKTLATINSIMISVNKDFKVVFLYRNYPVEYWNWHATSFGEKDNAQNESGFYTGIRWRTPYGTLACYYDQFKFPIASDKYLFPSQGNDFLIYYTVKVLRGSELRLKYKIKSKDDIGVINDQLGPVTLTKENYRAEFLYNISRDVSLKTRIDLANVH